MSLREPRVALRRHFRSAFALVAQLDQITVSGFLSRNAPARQEIPLRPIERRVQSIPIRLVKVVPLIDGHQVDDRALM